MTSAPARGRPMSEGTPLLTLRHANESSCSTTRVVAFTVLVAIVFGCVVGVFGMPGPFSSTPQVRGPSVENFEQWSAASLRSTKLSREGTSQASDGKVVGGRHHGMFEDDDAVMEKIPEFMRDYVKFHNEQVRFVAHSPTNRLPQPIG